MSTMFPNTVTRNPRVSLSAKTGLLFAWDVSILTLRLFLSTTENLGFETSKEEEKTNHQQQIQERVSILLALQSSRETFLCIIFEYVFLQLECLRHPCYFNVFIDNALALEESFTSRSLSCHHRLLNLLLAS